MGAATMKCLKCGYDLRGSTSTDHPVCPECSTVLTPADRRRYRRRRERRNQWLFAIVVITTLFALIWLLPQLVGDPFTYVNVAY